ncbi:DUF1054 domain-containing protein [Microaerobacter geothermalis]|nr:DUF1054 domain-containing protein [Microaerobacter geothermalis]
MTFQGFKSSDFDTFTIQGLDPRMDAIKENVRPKLMEIGQEIEPVLTTIGGEPFYFHVAKHARRTVNPPNDTWVAWATNKRGYKMLPHFQVGLWSTHLFIWFAIIYESPNKYVFADKALNKLHDLMKQIPEEFVWSTDHTVPDVHKHSDLSINDLQQMLERLREVKKSEILCGITLNRNNPIVYDGDLLLKKVADTFKTLFPLYLLAQSSS